MKVCPKCNESYQDSNLNFCLADGELLMQVDTSDAPPTLIMDPPRVTNEGNWGGNPSPNFPPPTQQIHQNQQIYQQPFTSPQNNWASSNKDQTLPIVSIVSGALSIVLSLCCYMGVLFGPVALITGFIGIKNENSNPDTYSGRNLAIAGMITGGFGLLASLLMLLLFIIGSIAG